jgi:glycosyltransferase involved in cell wall biosynthesis
MREAHLLDALCRLPGVETHLVVPGRLRDSQIRSAVTKVTELDVTERDWSTHGKLVRRAVDLQMAVAARYPREAFAQTPVWRAAAGVVKDAGADIVVVAYAGMAPLRRLVHKDRARWLLTFVNVPSRMDEQQAAMMPGGRHRWLFHRDAARAKRLEQWALEAFDQVVAISEEDAAWLHHEPVEVVPNGVDLSRFTMTALPRTPRIVFTGAMYTGPNLNGAIWLCREILPLVRRKVATATVDIVGAKPPSEVLALDRLDGVNVHPDVPDIRPYLEAARVAVVPLQIGSGTRLKALEALAAGRPVVGTTIGLEGLGLVDGRDVLVADEASTFAEQTVRLLGDDALAESLAQAGRRLVEECYSWEKIGKRFCDIVLGLKPASGRPGCSW